MRRPARILIIDDEEDLLRALRRLLRDHEVVAELHARDALARLGSGQSFDLILCDVCMPEMTGRALYEEMHRSIPDQCKRVAFLTGGTLDPSTGQWLEAAGRPVLPKPFDADQFRKFIERILG